MAISSQSTRYFNTTQRIGWPAYVYPTLPSAGTDNYWNRALAEVPTVELLIANIASGPGASANSDYVTALAAADTAGVTVLGYVDTNYGDRTAGLVTDDIDTWLSLYPVIEGIFFDRASPDPADVAYYQGIYDHAKAVLSGRRLVVLNAGTGTDEAYMACCDIAVTCENTAANYRTRTAASWEQNYPSRRFWHLVHTITDIAELNEMLTLSRQYRAGYVYFTTDIMDNPYDILPDDPFWSTQVTAVSGS